MHQGVGKVAGKQASIQRTESPKNRNHPSSCVPTFLLVQAHHLHDFSHVVGPTVTSSAHLASAASKLPRSPAELPAVTLLEELLAINMLPLPEPPAGTSLVDMRLTVLTVMLAARVSIGMLAARVPAAASALSKDGPNLLILNTPNIVAISSLQLVSK